MKYKLPTALLVVVALVVATLAATTVTTTRQARAAEGVTWPIDTFGTPRASDDVILKWNEQLLSVIRAYPAGTGPTITARALGVTHTATYDAWAAYDPVAKVTRPDGPSQQSAASNTLANKSEAISYAAYRALNDLFPSTRFPCIPASCPTDGSATYLTPDKLLEKLGYNPANTTTTPNTPAGVGNLAAQAVLTYRHRDGSNQLGDTAGGTPGVPYSDYTGYTPRNTWDHVNDRWHWQRGQPLVGLHG